MKFFYSMAMIFSNSFSRAMNLSLTKAAQDINESIMKSVIGLFPYDPHCTLLILSRPLVDIPVQPLYLTNKIHCKYATFLRKTIHLRKSPSIQSHLVLNRHCINVLVESENCILVAIWPNYCKPFFFNLNL